MQIEELINGTHLESKNIEYKGIISEGKDKSGNLLETRWLKTLVAFANTEGGMLIIGVEDKSHKVVALETKDADKIILMIHRKVRECIEPSINYDIETIAIDAKISPRYVIIVKVKASANLPVALHENGMLGIYVRNFGRTDLATQEQIRDMVLMSDNTPYDAPYIAEDYNEESFREMIETALKRGVKINQKLLISRNIISMDKKLSRGALLFMDKCSNPITKVVVTQWPGITKGSSYINASEEYVGNLLEVIDKTYNFIRNHSVNGFKKENDRRIDIFSYPARSVTEAIVNAIGHRNYYIQGSQIEVNIFKDRMEITSPGSLLGVRELKKEKNIAGIIPRRRNEIICSILEICRYMEEKGSGFDKIEEDYWPYAEEFKPYVSSDANSFTLTLPDLTFKQGIVDESTEEPDVYAEVALSGKNDLRILSICFARERTVREISEKLGLTPSSYFRKNVIERLVQNNLLLEYKSGNATAYKSNRELVKLAGM